MLGALICAIPLRKNIPVAMPLYLIAYAYGKAILGYRGPDDPIAPFQWDWTPHAFWRWTMSLGKPLGIGLVALAVVGYFVTELMWRAYVITAWQRTAAMIAQVLTSSRRVAESTGLVRWASNPASRARALSLSWPQPVIATIRGGTPIARRRISFAAS